MKKLIGALALAAMVATSAFAEVSFGAWICNLPTLVGSDGEDIKGGFVGNPWGGWRPVRLGAAWTSDDGKIGMNMGVSIENGSIGTFAPNTFWFKPIDQVKLTVGYMDRDFGVGSDLCYGSWDWLRPNTSFNWGERLTFSDYTTNGLGLEIFPTEALHIFLSIPLTTSADDAWKAFGKTQVGATYAIDGIGTIKAGFKANYNGGKTAAKFVVDKDDAKKKKEFDSYMDAFKEISKETDAPTTSRITYQAATYGGKSELGTIEAAFDLTGIDKLYATLGVAFTLHEDSDQQSLKVAAGASYGITEAFKVSADVSMSKSFASGSDPVLTFGAGVNYALSDALGLVADVRFALPNNSKDPNLSFLVGAMYSVGSNGALGIGFQGGVGLGDKSEATKFAGDTLAATEPKKFAWAVPIRATYSF
jgi:hypothetical protein